jgi:hypothetical protein
VLVFRFHRRYFHLKNRCCYRLLILLHRMIRRYFRLKNHCHLVKEMNFLRTSLTNLIL